ncbi:hypothetical protein MRB53_013895 [Persea americana]|uniref:Uncharacterized protein n=1 Tax=Persea americana TaxID=3435 RepID=A0ACC2K991_PERAE|nr:hypothetical protein MRB53_013895 [Persea americana]
MESCIYAIKQDKRKGGVRNLTHKGAPKGDLQHVKLIRRSDRPLVWREEGLRVLRGRRGRRRRQKRVFSPLFVFWASWRL